MSSLKDKFEDYREEPKHATWEQLLKRLDAELPVRRKRRYLLWLLPLLVVSSTTAWWLLAYAPATPSKAAHQQPVIESSSGSAGAKSAGLAPATTKAPASSAPVTNIHPYVPAPSANPVVDALTPPLSIAHDNPSINTPQPTANAIFTPLNPLEAWPGPLPLKENQLHAKTDNTLMVVVMPLPVTDLMDSTLEFIPIKPAVNNDNKFILGFDYAPGISNIILRDPLVNILSTKTVTQNKDLRNGISKNGFSQSFGVILKMDVEHHIRIKTGYYFTFVNQTLYYNTSAPNCHCGDSISLMQVDGSIKQSDISNKTDSISIGNSNSFTNRYSLREIPFIIEYAVPMAKNQRFSYTLSVGASYMYLRGVNILIPDADNVGFIAAINKNSSPAMFPSYQNTFNGIVGCGLNYRAKRNVEYSLAPEFKMALTSLSKNTHWFQEYPWQFHISFGIGKRF